MLEKRIVIFSDEEEACVNLLIATGMKNHHARVLVFLLHHSPSSAREIENGADLRQPEVSLSVNYLAGRGWISMHPVEISKKGRPTHEYTLVVPFSRILSEIEKDLRTSAASQLSMIRNIRSLAITEAG